MNRLVETWKITQYKFVRRRNQEIEKDGNISSKARHFMSKNNPLAS